jgi:hypothetical protein
MGADDGRDRGSWSWEDKSIANLEELRYGAISTTTNWVTSVAFGGGPLVVYRCNDFAAR